MKYVNSKKLDSIKLTKENFYVLIDFDRTLTKGNSISGWGVLYYSELLGNEFAKEYDEIHDNTNLSWEDIFKGYLELLHDRNLDYKLIREAIKKSNLQLRDGAKEFLQKMNYYNVPVIIISCSLKNVIKEYLKFNNCYYDNIHIYANNCGIEGESDVYNVTPINKNQVVFSKELNIEIESKKYTLLFGDIVDDINMVTKTRLNNTITVGFLDKKIEENLELYKSTFDIVLTENASFIEIDNIIIENF